MSVQFKNQKLTITLTAKDNDGDVINLSGKTIHFLTRDPSGNVDTDENPTIANPTNGQAKKVYAVDVLDEAGPWMAKLLIDGDEIPSTRYIFNIYETWDK